MTDQRAPPELAPQLEHAQAILEVIGSREVDVLIGKDGLSYVHAKVVRDMERNAALALRENETRFRVALANSPVVLFEQDLDLRYTWIHNPKLGYTAEEIIGKFDADLLDPAFVEPLVKLKRGVIDSGQSARQELPTALLGCPPEYYDLYVEPLRNDAGQIVGIICAACDITARTLAEQRLLQAQIEAERANNAKSRFLAAASHDLRQPLSALSLYTGILQNTPGSTDQDLVANMQVCIDSLSELLNDLLDLSKLEAGVVTPFIKDFAIADLFDSLASAHAPEARVKGLRLHFKAGSWTCRTDLVLLRRCLGNLIENALRYTKRGGVVVACRHRLGKTWVEVWDSGIGIPPDKTKEIFEEFKQLGVGARNSGSGLGLTIAAKTAALLGLEISVRSRVGRGSVFAIKLPLGAPAVTEQVPAESAQAPVMEKRSLRIALVEDNVIVREALADVLQRLGHAVLATATGAALLAELDLFEPDIVASDYRLAFNETGLDVITAVRARFGPEFPALLITGDTDPKLLRSMNARGIFVMHKSLNLETLQATLEKLTRHVG